MEGVRFSDIVKWGEERRSGRSGRSLDWGVSDGRGGYCSGYCSGLFVKILW